MRILQRVFGSLTGSKRDGDAEWGTESRCLITAIALLGGIVGILSAVVYGTVKVAQAIV